MPRRFGVALAFAIATALAPAAGAQTFAASPAVSPMGPALAAAGVAVRGPIAPRTDALSELATAARRHGDSTTALMIVGFGAFLAGAIIGGTAGTIIMIGGAFVGLYGLYMYLQ